MIGIVILAAGQSKRLGTSKQLLSFAGTTLLENTISVALQTDLKPLITVVPPKKQEILNIVANYPITVVENYRAQEGISSSIHLGVATMEDLYPEVEAIIFMVSDQPFVTTEILNNLILLYQEKDYKIAACKYKKGTIGIPALFASNYFEELKSLQGDQGAKKIMMQHISHVGIADFDKGQIDIDTQEDYLKYCKPTEQ